MKQLSQAKRKPPNHDLEGERLLWPSSDRELVEYSRGLAPTVYEQRRPMPLMRSPSNQFGTARIDRRSSGFKKVLCDQMPFVECCVWCLLTLDGL